jgi:6-phosphogluconolactonase
MKIQIFPDADIVAQAAATLVAETARNAVEARGKFIVAFSGGKAPWQMLRALAGEVVPWPLVEIFQVDERVAPAGDPDRNLTHLRESLLSHAPLKESQIHAMPVEDADLSSAAQRYAAELQKIAGRPAIFDLVHLGMGPDGHCASLVPGDPVLKITDADVALTGIYQGRRRMTLTYPVINRARQIMWLVTDGTKADALVRMLDADPTIPAGHIHREHANLLADEPAAAKLEKRG